MLHPSWVVVISWGLAVTASRFSWRSAVALSSWGVSRLVTLIGEGTPKLVILDASLSTNKLKRVQKIWGSCYNLLMEIVSSHRESVVLIDTHRDWCGLQEKNNVNKILQNYSEGSARTKQKTQEAKCSHAQHLANRASSLYKQFFFNNNRRSYLSNRPHSQYLTNSKVNYWEWSTLKRLFSSLTVMVSSEHTTPPALN